MFDKATRYAFRYPTVRGTLTTEQLWELPLQSNTGFDLDTVAQTINVSLKAHDNESFVEPTGSGPTVERLRELLAVVVHIIRVKKEERDAAAAAAARKRERDKLLGILHIRNTQDLLAKPASEIQAMIDSLN